MCLRIENPAADAAGSPGHRSHDNAGGTSYELLPRQVVSAAPVGKMSPAGRRRRGGGRTMPEPEIPIERFEIFATGLDHPECLAFDRAGVLWAGGEAGQVYRIDAAGQVQAVAALGGFTGGIAFSP